MHDYQELTLSYSDEYYRFVGEFFCYSDLNFVSLMCWSAKVLYKQTDEYLAVIFEDYESNNRIITGIARTKSDELIKEMLDIHRNDPSIIIDAIPEHTYLHIHNKELASHFTFSPDQSDYLYMSKTQIKLEGSIFSWYRRKLSIFKRLMIDHPVSVSVNANASHLDLNAYNLIWQDWSTKVNHKEAAAMFRYITLFPHLKNQSILTISIDNEIKAFAFLETVNCKDKTVLIHFFKSSKEYEGLANYLFQEIARYAQTIGVKWLNFEQDLGEEGLRQYKQKLCPDTLLKKFSFSNNFDED